MYFYRHKILYMKKILLSVTALMAFNVAQAQDFRIGPKFGLNYANIRSEPKTDGAIIGYNAGAIGELVLNETISIQTEILYSTQGAKLADGGTRSEIGLNYLLIPIMVKYYIKDGLNIEAGPQYGRLLSVESDDNMTGLFDVWDSYKDSDISFNAGVEYYFDWGMFVQARYSVGLTDINDSALFENEKYNNVFSLSVGLKL